MRVLLVHNYYGSSAPSGENQVFEAERSMLQRHGVEVEAFTRHSDEIRLVVGGWWLVNGLRKVWGLVKGAMCTVANPFAARALRKKIREFNPDVVHFHNTFPLISPLAIRAAKKSGAKVVMTLHNYRMVCAAGVPMRDGKVCRECFVLPEESSNRVRRTILPAICHRCYRDSLLATVPLAINIWLYRKCWAKWVDKFIVLSEFQRGIMIECGLPADKVVVKGNFVTIPNQAIEQSDNASARSSVVFVGRLSDEKGVKTLLKAWRLPMSLPSPRTFTSTLALIGDGDQRTEYEKLAKGLNVKFLGKLPHSEVMKVVSASKFLALPSECWEGMPMTVLEAFSVGTPVIVSDLGALPDYVGHGKFGEIFKAGDADGLAGAIVRLERRLEREDVGIAAREQAVREYSEGVNLERLMAVYR